MSFSVQSPIQWLVYSRSSILNTEPTIENGTLFCFHCQFRLHSILDIDLVKKKKVVLEWNTTTFWATYDSPNNSPLLPKYLLLLLRLLIEEIPFQNSFSEVHFLQNVMMQKHKENISRLLSHLLTFGIWYVHPIKKQNKLLNDKCI